MQFILTDIGSHILDTSRYPLRRCDQYLLPHDAGASRHQRRGCRDRDDAMGDGISVVCEMSYASRTEIERFPQTYVYIEGEKGFLELGPDYNIRETTAEGTCIRRFPPKHYPWADPAYDLVHSSIVDAQADLLQHLKGEKTAETTGDDNLKTVMLVHHCYEFAATGQVVFV